MTRLKHLQPLLLRHSKYKDCSHRLLSAVSSNGENIDSNSANESAKKKKINRPMYIPDPPEVPLTLEDLEEPTTCCMSGCANCVWIEYAEKLSALVKGSQSDVQKMIMDKVQDPNMRAFLSMELRIRKLIE